MEKKCNRDASTTAEGMKEEFALHTKLSKRVLRQPEKRLIRRRRRTPTNHGGAIHICIFVCFLAFSLHCCGDAHAESQSSQHDLTDIGHQRLVTDVDMSDVDFASDDASSLAADVIQHITGASLEKRLAKLLEKAHTAQCRAKIAKHFSYFINAIGKEEPLPFTQVQFENKCPQQVYTNVADLPDGMHVGHLQNLEYQPPRNESAYVEAEDLKLLYGILTHEDPAATIRLIESLYEPGHSFVIHVDGKESSEETYRVLRDYAANATRSHYIRVLEAPYRVRVTWGGFSMVNATLQVLRHALALDSTSVQNGYQAMDFHKFVHLSSSSYPLAPNTEIRQKLASYPVDANFLYVLMMPTRPGKHGWFYFVECDDQLHRIYRLEPLNNATGGGNTGVELYSSSQWFVISRDFAQYLAESKPGTFVHAYLEYIQHVVVADETFFGTVIRNTEYCTKHHNQNFLHLQFDEWESELPAGERDPQKCMMLDPNHCGRSPTTMTLEDTDILELSGDLFARKFVDSVDSRVKDAIDDFRAKREHTLHAPPTKTKELDQLFRTFGEVTREGGLHFEGHGLLIVAKETVGDSMPLCLGLSPAPGGGNELMLVPCFHDWVPKTLGEKWETGGVIFSETPPKNRWDIGPCTSDGTIERLPSGEMNATRGKYSITGPRCTVKLSATARAGRCIDTDSDDLNPSGKIRLWPCVHRWQQFLSFGDGRLAPKNSIFSTLPSQVVGQIKKMGHVDHIPYMCLGVRHRGKDDGGKWSEDYDDSDDDSDDYSEDYPDVDFDEYNNNGLQWPPLSKYSGVRIKSMQCNNIGGVIEWLFVPYVVEEDEDAENDKNSTNATSVEEDTIIQIVSEEEEVESAPTITKAGIEMPEETECEEL